MVYLFRIAIEQISQLDGRVGIVERAMIAVAKNGIRCVALARDHHKALVVA